MDFVDDHHTAVFRLAELVLGIHENEPLFRAVLLPDFEQGKAHFRRLVEILLRDAPHGQYFIPGAGNIVIPVLGLGGGRQNRRGQLLVFLHPVGQRIAAEQSAAFFIMSPNRGGGGAGQISAHHHFRRQRLAVHHLHDLRIRDTDHMIGNRIPGQLKPKSRRTVEHLSFERQGPEHSVKRRNTVRGYNESFRSADIGISNLAFGQGSEPRIVCFVKGARQSLFHSFFIDHGNSPYLLKDCPKAIRAATIFQEAASSVNGVSFIFTSLPFINSRT